jgi:hypothetical protein
MSEAVQANPAAHDAPVHAQKLKITGGERVFRPRVRENHQGGCLYLTDSISASMNLVVKPSCFGYSFALALQR